MHYGADYYPEHWPPERWGKDAELMEAAGINVVRMAEFAWAKMEPEEKRYDFTWLDQAIDILGRRGIKTILCTPTATPPKWLVDKHPEILPVDERGVVRWFGSRRHYCANSDVYREYSRRITRAMAEHFESNPQVIGWQTDNEFGCHDTARCYCDACLEKFRLWAKNKYETIDNLNANWGTVFWSQTYSSFDQLIIPRQAVTSHNPSLLLDYRRFSSDAWVAFQKEQIDILREVMPAHWVTHNMMGLFGDLDYYALAADLDFVAWDNYPRYAGKPNPAHTALAHDVMWGVKQKNFWVMEQQSGPTGWEHVSTPPRPGELRLWAHQAVAHGADGIVYFRWRTCRFGTEEYWHGILDHDGIPRRRYAEIKQTGEELQKIWPLLQDTTPRAEVGLLYSYDQRWALEIQPHSRDFNYVSHLMGYYEQLHKANIGVRILSEEADFSGVKVLIAPTLFLMTPQIAARLKAFVQGGGILIGTIRSGVKDWNNVVTEKTLPGELAELFGTTVEEYTSLSAQDQVSLSAEWDGLQEKGHAHYWCDRLRPVTAKVLARYTDSYLAGEGAVTCNQLGSGLALYVGTVLNRRLISLLLDWAVEKVGVKAIARPVDGVEFVERKGARHSLLFVLNHNEEEQELLLPRGYSWDVFAGKTVSGAVGLAPLETRVFTNKRP